MVKSVLETNPEIHNHPASKEAGRFEVGKKVNLEESLQVPEGDLTEPDFEEAKGALEKKQIDHIVQEAVQEQMKKDGVKTPQELSAKELGDIITNVEVNIGQKLDGMDPKTLLETLLNLPRSQN